jgi:hypothetical protein
VITVNEEAKITTQTFKNELFGHCLVDDDAKLAGRFPYQTDRLAVAKKLAAKATSTSLLFHLLPLSTGVRISDAGNGATPTVCCSLNLAVSD